MRSSRLRPLLFSFMLLTTGCPMESVTTDITVRDPARATIVRTDVRGSVRLPLPADGHIRLDAPAAPSVTLRSPGTIARWCTMMSREPRGQKLDYEIVADPKCVDSPVPGSVGYALLADWADVRIVEHHRPERAYAWASVALTTVLYGALVAAIFLEPHMLGGMATRWALGGTTAAIGLGFDAAMIPTIVAPDSDVVIHDFATRPLAR